MQLFSEDYLMHYGIKGMKWKKKKKQPADYLEEAYQDLGYKLDGKNVTDVTFSDRNKRRSHRYNTNVPHYANPSIKYYPKEYIASTYKVHREAKQAEALADKRRNADLKEARKKAYKKNQKRVGKQQRRAKVKNAVNRIKKKVFVDTSGKQKVGNLYVSHDTHLGR